MQPWFEPGRYSSSSLRESLAPEFEGAPDDIVLPANTLVRYAIPTGARYVTFSFDGDFRCVLGGSTTDFTLPATSSAGGTGSVLNPTQRRIPAKLADGISSPTHLCFRAASACTGSVSFFS